MKPIRKPFLLDPVFPFELTYEGTRFSENELPDHLHELFEIVYVHRGKGIFFIDHAHFEMRTGDLFLIPGNTVHRSFPSTEDPIVSTALFFAPSFVHTDSIGEDYDSLRCFNLARKRKHYQISLSALDRSKFEIAIHAMSIELKEKSLGYRHATWLALQHLLLEINRYSFALSSSEPSTGFAPPWIQQALNDINRNPVHCGGLQELSEKACVSPSHFSRVFKLLTGMNVTDYVNAKRLILAKDLLLMSNDKIETIAQTCGFHGMRHFYQSFKKLTGLTPKEYRRQKL